MRAERRADQRLQPRDRPGARGPRQTDVLAVDRGDALAVVVHHHADVVDVVLERAACGAVGRGEAQVPAVVPVSHR